MKDRIVSATEFKAKCLAFLDEMEGQSGTITITKRGKPVAVLGPPKKPRRKSLAGVWAGKMEIIGDIVNTDTADLWEVVNPQSD